MKIKNLFISVSIAATILFSTSCSNFLNGSELKKQIDDSIADNEFYSVERPSVLNTNPVNGARNIARNSSIRILFSEELNTATLDLDSSVTQNMSEENLIKAGDGSDHIVGYIKDGQKVFNKIKISILSGSQILPAENYFNAPYVKRNYIELWPDTNNVIPANSEVKIEVSLDIQNKDGITAGKPNDVYVWSYNYGDKLENSSPVISSLNFTDASFEQPENFYNFDKIKAYLTDTVEFTITSIDNDTGFAAGDNQTVIITEEVISDFANPFRNGEKSSSTFTPVINECAFGNITTDKIKYKLTNQNEGVYKISVIVLDDNGAASDLPEELYLFKYEEIPANCLSIQNSTLKSQDEFVVDVSELEGKKYDELIMEKLWNKCLNFSVDLTDPSIKIGDEEYKLNYKITGLTLNIAGEDTIISGEQLKDYFNEDFRHLDLTAFKNKLEERTDDDLIITFEIKDFLGNSRSIDFIIPKKSKLTNKIFFNNCLSLYTNKKSDISCLYFYTPLKENKTTLFYEDINEFYANWNFTDRDKFFYKSNADCAVNPKLNSIFDDQTKRINIDCLVFISSNFDNLYGYPFKCYEHYYDSNDSTYQNISSIDLSNYSVTPDGKNSNSYTFRYKIDLTGYDETNTTYKNYFSQPDSNLYVYLSGSNKFVKAVCDDSKKIITFESKFSPKLNTDFLDWGELKFYEIYGKKIDLRYINIYCGYDVSAPYFTDNKLSLSDPLIAGVTPPTDDKSGFLWQNSKTNCNYYFTEYKNYWNGYKDILTEEEIKKLPLQGTTYFDSSKLYIPLNNLSGKYLLCINVEDNAKNYYYTTKWDNKTTYYQKDYYGSNVFNNNFCNGITVVNSERFQNKANFNVSSYNVTANLDVSPEAAKNLNYKFWISAWNNSTKKFDSTKSSSSSGLTDNLNLNSTITYGTKWYRFQITGEESTKEESTFVFSEPEYYYYGTNSYTFKNVTDDQTFGTTIWCDKSTFYRVLSSPYDYGNDFTKWSKYAKTVKEDEISTNTSIDVSAVPQGEYYVIQAYFSDAQKTKWMSEVHKK